MEFLYGHEYLTVYEWILRAVAAFLFLVIIARILGQRTIAQLRLLDFVIALVIGNIIANPLSDEKIGMMGSVITTAVLVVLYLIGIFIKLKFPSLRKLLNSVPIIIVKEGKILHKNLNKARITVDVLLEELREDKVEDIKKVALAIWETDGKISIFLDPQHEPLTPYNYKMKTEPFDMPRTIIKDGKIISEEIKEIQKDENWVISNLQKQFNADVKDVLLATVDRKGNIKVFLYI